MEFPKVVICGNCGFVQPAGIQMSGEYSGVTIRGARQTCRRCGRWIALPDGVFASVKRSAEVLIENPGTVEQIRQLSDALLDLAETQPSEAQVREALRGTGIRGADELAKTAPDTPRDRRIWAAALVGAIAYVWEKVPAGANSWIEFFENVRRLLAS